MSTRLIKKYVQNAENVLKTINLQTKPISLKPQATQSVIEQAKAYLEDSKYYLKQRKLSVSLTSIAYCEGLLDALRLIGVAHFEWLTNNAVKQEK